MRLILVLWYVGWAYIAVPWRSFRAYPSFERIEFVPFAGSMRSQILNLLAFIPLGFLGSRLGWTPKTIALVGAGTSLLTELLQLFSARRFSSATDVVLNTVGTLLGIIVARAWQSRNAAP